MKPGFSDYVQEAFSARPIGMFMPPNWVGLGIFAFLGLLNPGFWVIGIGLELGYLGILAHNERFQRLVAAKRQWESRRQWQSKVDELVSQLGAEGQRRYRALEVRCRSILEQQVRGAAVSSGLDAQGEGLGRLLWVYLRLLLTRQAIERIVQEASDGSEDSARLQERVENLKTRLAQDNVSEDLRKSLSSQIDILQQRIEKRREAREKIAFLDAELMRIQEQVELVREQAVLSTDPETVSQRIDQITTTLGGTSQWISEQQKIYGAVEDLLAEPPPLAVNMPTRQSQ
jgi:hypothetical protein